MEAQRSSLHSPGMTPTATPRGMDRYAYDPYSSKRAAQPPSRIRASPLISQNYIVNQNRGLDSVAAWSQPATIAAAPPRRPALLDLVRPTHSNEDDMKELQAMTPDRPRTPTAPFANNHRLKVENPVYKQLTLEKKREARKRHHMDCVGIFFFLFLMLGCIAAYGFGLWKSQFWQTDATADASFRIPPWAHPFIVLIIVVEIIFLIGFIARWYKSYRR